MEHTEDNILTGAFVVYYSDWQTAEMLKQLGGDETFKEFLTAMANFVFWDEDYQGDDLHIKLVWPNVKIHLENSRTRYEDSQKNGGKHEKITIEELKDLLTNQGRQFTSYQAVADVWNASHPDRTITRQAISAKVKKLGCPNLNAFYVKFPISNIGDDIPPEPILPAEGPVEVVETKEELTDENLKAYLETTPDTDMTLSELFEKVKKDFICNDTLPEFQDRLEHIIGGLEND